MSVWECEYVAVWAPGAVRVCMCCAGCPATFTHTMFSSPLLSRVTFNQQQILCTQPFFPVSVFCCFFLALLQELLLRLVSPPHPPPHLYPPPTVMCREFDKPMVHGA